MDIWRPLIKRLNFRSVWLSGQPGWRPSTGSLGSCCTGYLPIEAELFEHGTTDSAILMRTGMRMWNISPVNIHLWHTKCYIHMWVPSHLSIPESSHEGSPYTDPKPRACCPSDSNLYSSITNILPDTQMHEHVRAVIFVHRVASEFESSPEPMTHVFSLFIRSLTQHSRLSSQLPSMSFLDWRLQDKEFWCWE